MLNSANSIDEPLEKQLAISLSNYYSKGSLLLSVSDCDSLLSMDLSVQSSLLLAEHYDILKDGKKTIELLMSSLNSKEIKDNKTLLNETLFQINLHLTKNEFDSTNVSKYIRKSKDLIADKTDSVNYILFESIRIVQLNLQEEKDVLKSLKGVLETCTSNYQKATIYNLIGNYYSFILNNDDEAIDNYDLASSLLEPYDNFFYQDRRNSIQVNKAISFFQKGDLDVALYELRTTTVLHRSLAYELLISYWKSKIFEEKREYDSAYVYLNYTSKIKDSINKPEMVSRVLGIEHDYEIKEKEEELLALSEDKKKLKGGIFILLPLAVLLLLTSLYIYKRFVKTKKEKSIIQSEHEQTKQEKSTLEKKFDEILASEKALQKEKEETIERLKELKEVVTKDFIILQDKTKVYVEELMFIQSDDHYLKVHLHEKKDNYVRGKLSQILKDLPPNFKRCHRSYIVNENYIRQINTKTIELVDESKIPLSKTYKDNF